MKTVQTLLDDVQVLQSPAFVDERGSFTKLFSQATLPAYQIQQVNYVQNSRAGILRGLHYQKNEWAESKFFRVLRGRIQLAFVDVRHSLHSPAVAATFVLDRPDIGVLVPRGFATGYLTLVDDTDVLYYSDNAYHPSAEGGIRWDDPAFALPWQTTTPDLSDKDAAWSFVAPVS